MKAIFMGTPQFAVPSLDKLINSRHTVCMVITQPDKKNRRAASKKTDEEHPPVKVFAQAKGLKVIQPQRLSAPDFMELMTQSMPDVIVVTAYGKILPLSVLNIPKKGCVNLHASLLPQYRGAAPIQWAIIDGQPKTGVTTIKMDEGIDTGPIYLTQEENILQTDTYQSLGARLSVIGADLLIKTLDMLEDGDIIPKEQSLHYSYARSLIKEDGLIDWSKTAQQISCAIKGMYPWPCAYTFINGERIKIIEAVPVDGKGGIGEIISQNDVGLIIGTKIGLLSILKLQPAGKTIMSFKAFLKGRQSLGGWVR